MNLRCRRNPKRDRESATTRASTCNFPASSTSSTSRHLSQPPASMVHLPGTAPGCRICARCPLTRNTKTDSNLPKRTKVQRLNSKILCSVRQDEFIIGSFIPAYHERQCWCGDQEEGDSYKIQGDLYRIELWVHFKILLKQSDPERGTKEIYTSMRDMERFFQVLKTFPFPQLFSLILNIAYVSTGGVGVCWRFTGSLWQETDIKWGKGKIWEWHRWEILRYSRETLQSTMRMTELCCAEPNIRWQ